MITNKSVLCPDSCSTAQVKADLLDSVGRIFR